jgi:hypothetical protein
MATSMHTQSTSEATSHSKPTSMGKRRRNSNSDSDDECDLPPRIRLSLVPTNDRKRERETEPETVENKRVSALKRETSDGRATFITPLPAVAGLMERTGRHPRGIRRPTIVRW